MQVFVLMLSTPRLSVHTKPTPFRIATNLQTMYVYVYVDVSAILGPAMVVSAPAVIDDHTDPEMDTFYLSEYHMQGARYHGGPSHEAYLKFKDIHWVDTNMPAADAEDSDS